MIRPSLEFYNFNKKVNSTLRPTGEYITAMFAEWVEDTPVTSPSFLCNLSEVAMDDINYCYSTILNRYYWVTDIIWVGNNLYRVNCKCDVLATYGAEIKTSEQYVARSASAYDGRISDGFYPLLTSIDSVNTLTKRQSIFAPSQYQYVIGIKSPQAVVDNFNASQGTVVYYRMTYTCMKEFIRYMLNDVGTYSGIQEYGEGITKALVDPLQYIVSCRCYPSDFLLSSLYPFAQNVYKRVDSIQFGVYTWNITLEDPYKPLMLGVDTLVNGESSYIVGLWDVVEIPKHPQAVRGSYMNSAPFTSHTLLTPYGMISIDTIKSSLAKSLILTYRIDVTTGQTECLVFSDDDKTADEIMNTTDPFSPYPINYETMNLVAREILQVGIEIQLSSLITNGLEWWASAGSTVFSVGSNIVTGNYASLPSNLFNGIINSYEASLPTLKTTGTVGSRLSFEHAPYYLISEFKAVVDDSNDEYGRPLMQVRRLDTLEGYIQCSHAHITTHSGMYKSEAEEIESFLESGVFIE